MTTRVSTRSRTAARPRLEPRRTPIQRRSRLTVEDILAAAAQVFEEHGFAAGTTNRIAERAGVSIGTLYQYFPGKEAVAAALLERHMREAMGRLDAWIAEVVARPRPLHEALRFLVEQTMALHAGRPRLHHVLFEETRLPPRLHGALDEWARETARKLAGFMRGFPEVRHPRPTLAANLALQAVEALAHRFAAHPSADVPAAAFAGELTAMLEAYLRRTR